MSAVHERADHDSPICEDDHVHVQVAVDAELLEQVASALAYQARAIAEDLPEEPLREVEKHHRRAAESLRFIARNWMTAP